MHPNVDRVKCEEEVYFSSREGHPNVEVPRDGLPE